MESVMIDLGRVSEQTKGFEDEPYVEALIERKPNP